MTLLPLVPLEACFGVGGSSSLEEVEVRAQLKSSSCPLPLLCAGKSLEHHSANSSVFLGTQDVTAWADSTGRLVCPQLGSVPFQSPSHVKPSSCPPSAGIHLEEPFPLLYLERETGGRKQPTDCDYSGWET